MYGVAHTLMEFVHIDLKKMLYEMSFKNHSAKVSKAAFDCPILKRFDLDGFEISDQYLVQFR